MARWPEGKNEPGSVRAAANSVYSADGWPWLYEQLMDLVEHNKVFITEGNGASSWDEYQYRLGMIEGLSKMISLLGEWVDPVTGEQKYE